jgi:hypothetical protein
MCGRAAQTVSTSQIAAASLGITNLSRIQREGSMPDTSNEIKYDDSEVGANNTDKDNFNMSPGMDAAVIWMENGQLKMDRKMYVHDTGGFEVRHHVR